MELTDKQKEALNEIWKQVRTEVLETSGEQILPRDTVITIVLSNDRPQSLFPEIDWTAFFALPYGQRFVLARTALTHSFYGHS